MTTRDDGPVTYIATIEDDVTGATVDRREFTELAWAEDWVDNYSDDIYNAVIKVDAL